jgi:hypothetical protein
MGREVKPSGTASAVSNNVIAGVAHNGAHRLVLEELSYGCGAPFSTAATDWDQHVAVVLHASPYEGRQLGVGEQTIEPVLEA